MKTGLIVKAYLAKAKRQIIVTVLLLVTASVLLNMWLMLQTDYHENYWCQHDAQNGAHIIVNCDIAAPGNQIEDISAFLSGRDDVEDFEITRMAFFNGGCQFGENRLESNFSILSIESVKSRKIDRFEILNGTDGETSGVYLPYIFKANSFFEEGDTFELTVADRTFEWKVLGFYNSATNGTINCLNIPLILDADSYNEMRTFFPENNLSVALRITDSSVADMHESDFAAGILKCTDNLMLSYSSNYLKLYSSRYVSQTVCAGTSSVATIITVVMLLTVISVSLLSYVRENMRNLGVFKAMGYVSRDLIAPLVSTFAILSAVCSAIGIAISYALFPLLNGVMETQVGIPYQIGFLAVPAVLTAALIVSVVCITVFLSVLPIGKIQPIMAIRVQKASGVGNSVLPLKSSRLPLDVSLSVKNTVSGLKRYVVFFICMLMVSVMLGFACFCYQYIFVDHYEFLNLLMGKEGDAELCVAAYNEQELVDAIEQDGMSQNSYIYMYNRICHKGGSTLAVEILDENGIETAKKNCVHGHMPTNENEVAVNCFYARVCGLEIGDKMILSVSDNECEFTVCGITQGAAYSGRNVLLLRSGYERMNALAVVSYTVILNDDVDVNEYIEDMCIKAPVVYAKNYREYLAANSASYIKVMKILTVAIIALSIIITVVVLYILVNQLLFSKRREHGIMKSLGFVTRQIVFQTAMSFMPVGIPAIVLGLAISRNSVGNFLAKVISNIGMEKFTMPISVKYLAICGAVMIVFTFVITCILSGRVRRLTPHSLFNNE